MLERLSKLTVVLSACVAVLCGAWLGAREWAPLFPMTVAALVGGAVAGRLWGTRAWIPVLVCANVLPALFLLTRGVMNPAYWNLWLAALLGGVLGNADVFRWAFPPRWKWPLAYWALAVALVWPVIIAREADFSWALMSRYNLANSGLGGPPPVIGVWIMSVAVTQMLGLLWLDAAFVAFPLDDRARSARAFARHVVWPLAAGVFLGSAVAMYQGAVDINWLSGHQWPFYNRASGSLDDGNAFGPLAGFWTGAFLALAATARHNLLRFGAILGACAACAGLWATGSRMALLAALICFAFSLKFAVAARKWSRRDLAVVGLPAIAMAGALFVFVAWSSTASPIDRVRASLPGFSKQEVRKFVRFELWNRFGPFGSAAVEMVREYPLSGIGVGSFNHVFPDYAFVLAGDRAHMDNAQSWYRQQLAELGVIGSLGWLIWVPMFGWVLARTRGDDDQRFAATMVKSALVAVAVVSAISLTQIFPVALLVWVLVFWYLLLSADATAIVTRPWRLSRSPVWGVAAFALVLVLIAATVRSGVRDLRPPFRAIRADWTYQVGFFDLETPAGRPAFRWTEKHAVLVFPVTGAWLKLTVAGGPADIATHPVTLEVRRRGTLILTAARSASTPQTWYVKAPSAEKRMMLEFDVSRTWRPSAPGSSGDDHEFGVAVDDWTFVAAPPADAVIIR